MVLSLPASIRELSSQELLETEGGILPFLLAAGAVLLASCGTNTATNNEGSSNTAIAVQCQDCQVTIVNAPKDSIQGKQ